jgi:K+-sensing histidine kinase KdpD
MALAVWGVIIFGMRISPDVEQAYLWERWLVPLAPLMSVLLYHFAIRLTAKRIESWVLPVLYSTVVLFIPLTMNDLVFTGMQTKPYGFAPVFGPAVPFWWGFTHLVTIMALVIFIKSYRKSASYEEKNRIAYIVVGIAFTFIGGAFDLLPVLGLPLYPGGIISTIIFCVLVTVAIVKYKLLDIQVAFRKGLAYALTSVVLAIPFLALYLVLTGLSVEGGLSIWLYLILLLILALVVPKLWNVAQQQIDKLFYRGRLDFLKALQDFSKRAHYLGDFTQLSRSVVNLIKQGFHSSTVLLLAVSKSRDFKTVASVNGQPLELTVPWHSPLLRWMSSNKKILHKQEMFLIPELHALTAREIDGLNRARAELVIPILSTKDMLLGLIILGEKLSQQPYSIEEEELISIVVERMAVELENVYLYEQEKIMRQELEELDRQKTEFLHSVAHELKTPLTAVLSSSELLFNGSSIAPDLKKRLVNNIRQGAVSMNKRVGELLDLAKIQVDKLEIEPKPLRVGSVVQNVASQLKVLFDNNRQRLKLEIASELPKVSADRGKLEQILNNLLTNANKFSPAGTDVAVRVKNVDRDIFVEVEDSAPRVPDDAKEKIFSPYYRGGDSKVRQRLSGLGLGLAIAKRLVELHGGQIWVESRPGSGNVFVFSLPTLVEE